MLLLLEDLRVAALLFNAARYRTLQRWLGLDKTGANLVTLVALAAAVDAAQRQTARIVPPGAPGANDFALSTAVAESALRTVAGLTASGAAPGSALLTLAIVFKLVGTPARRAARGIARSPFRLRAAVMAQAQRLGEVAAATAARARDTAEPASSGTQSTGG